MPLPRWTDTLVIALASTVLCGCATNKEELLTHRSSTMLDIWNQASGKGGDSDTAGSQIAHQLLDARQVLRRPLTELPTESNTYTRTAQTEIERQFQRLPNPDLVMFVFPHLAGAEPAPVPGYSTVFPLYQRVQYALPGERTAAH